MAGFLDQLQYTPTGKRTQPGRLARLFKGKGRPIFDVESLSFEIGHKGSGVVWKTQKQESDFNSIPWLIDQLGFDPLSHFKKPSIIHDDGYKRHAYVCDLIIRVMWEQEVELRIFGIHVNKRYSLMPVRKFCDLIYLHAMQVVIERNMPKTGTIKRLWFRFTRLPLYARALMHFAAVCIGGRRGFYRHSQTQGDTT